MAALIPDIPQVEIEIVMMTNSFRSEHKLAAVKPSPALAAAARAYATYLAKTDAFSHTADGRQPHERTTAAGYQHCQVAENLALNLDSRDFVSKALASQAVEGWKSSPGHRRNMLLPDVTEIGVAVARAPAADPKFISVQLFGRPMSLAYEIRVVNETGDSLTYDLAGKGNEARARSIVTHTVCQPGAITFQRSGSALFGTSLKARYDTRDGDTFTLKADPKGAPRIEHTPRKAARQVSQ